MIKLKGLNKEQTAELLPPSGLILLGYRGSISHGTYEPNHDPNSIDDKDIMGVFINPLDHYLGMKTREHHMKFVGEWDAENHELIKFVRLLCKSNPNVLSLLWLDEVHYIYRHPVGQMLIDYRDLFVSKEAYHSFAGYASGQFHRMTHMAFKGYMGEKRKGLVEKHGFDTKNAAHLIRLLEMGIEYLTEGRLHVTRQNASTLLAIKHGEWCLEKVKAEAERLFALAKEAYVRSALPVTVDQDKINILLACMIKKYHNLK